MFKQGDRVHMHDGTVHVVDHDGLPSGLRARRKRRVAGEAGVRVRGFMRGALVDSLTGKEEMGDWYENVITQEGHRQIIRNFVGLTGSAMAQWWAIGSTTVAASSDFSTTSVITSEWGTASASGVNAAGAGRANVAANQSYSSIWTLTQSFQYASSQINSTCTINALAQCSQSSMVGGSVLSLATFASSTKGSSQALNVTYNWSFGT